MIKAAINRILELATPTTLGIEGQLYCNQNLKRVNKELRAEPLRVNSLSSLIDYIKGAKDLKSCDYIVQIVSPEKVSLISSLDTDRERETLMVAVAELPEFSFGRNIPHESFIIGVRSKFKENSDRELVLKFAGTVKSGTVKEYGDDGITQKATVKHGVSSMSEAIVPSPCQLAPYRTFIEVEQPESSFIFRLKEDSDGEISCALHEADGGAWRLEAIKNIKQYLSDQLGDQGNILIIS